jgi:hypothetical protein
VEWVKIKYTLTSALGLTICLGKNTLPESHNGPNHWCAVGLMLTRLSNKLSVITTMVQLDGEHTCVNSSVIYYCIEAPPSSMHKACRSPTMHNLICSLFTPCWRFHFFILQCGFCYIWSNLLLFHNPIYKISHFYGFCFLCFWIFNFHDDLVCLSGNSALLLFFK